MYICCDFICVVIFVYFFICGFIYLEMVDFDLGMVDMVDRIFKLLYLKNNDFCGFSDK